MMKLCLFRDITRNYIYDYNAMPNHGPTRLSLVSKPLLCSRGFVSGCSLEIVIGWPFSLQLIADQCWRRRGRKILKILGKKNTIFNEHLV